MAHIKHPLVGDPAYGGRLRLLRNATPELTEALRACHRQALHATMLKLAHPITGEVMEWHSPRRRMVALMEVLRADTLANPDDLVWN
jgi:23S rRNA pseudouridine1911/1915/1917 synthase